MYQHHPKSHHLSCEKLFSISSTPQNLIISLTQAKIKLKQASSWKRIVGEIAAPAWPSLSLSL
jgi:hypothetical protein